MNEQIAGRSRDRRSSTSPTRFPAGSLTYHNLIATIVPALIAVVLGTGCASTRVTSGERLVTEKLPRPDHIWVYDFAATAADVPAESAFAGQTEEPGKPPTAEELKLGRELGSKIAANLITEISKLGLPAVLGAADTKPQVNDIVIRGYLLSIEQGSTAKRMVIGFGSGASELQTAIEGFQMTANGLRKLGSAKLESGGSKGPGASLGAAGWLITGNPLGLIVGGGMKVYGEASGSSKVEGRAKATAQEISKVLKQRFRDQGWIK